jgi:hypothetical protein
VLLLSDNENSPAMKFRQVFRQGRTEIYPANLIVAANLSNWCDPQLIGASGIYPLSMKHFTRNMAAPAVGISNAFPSALMQYFRAAAYPAGRFWPPFVILPVAHAVCLFYCDMHKRHGYARFIQY